MDLRKASVEDLPEIQKLYNYYILNTNALWHIEGKTLEYYENSFRERKEKHPLFVAYDGNEFLGFASLNEFRGSAGYNRICENSIYLKQSALGKGYGKLMMQKLVSEADKLGYFAITAWIDSDNNSSIDFHRNFGFYEVGTMKNIGCKGPKKRSVTIMQLDFDND